MQTKLELQYKKLKQKQKEDTGPMHSSRHIWQEWRSNTLKPKQKGHMTIECQNAKLNSKPFPKGKNFCPTNFQQVAQKCKAWKSIFSITTGLR